MLNVRIATPPWIELNGWMDVHTGIASFYIFIEKGDPVNQSQDLR